MDVRKYKKKVKVPALKHGAWKAEPVQLSFPPEDYNRKGKLKTVRKSMLSKLFKYESKLIRGSIFSAVGLMLLAILSGFSLRFVGEEIAFLEICSILLGGLYMITTISFLFSASITPILRYYTNFFKAEGYLTFSIPASMEEQLFAKRISAIISIVIANVAVFISILLFGSFLGGASFWVGLGELFAGSFMGILIACEGSLPLAILMVAEIVVLNLVSLPFLHCIAGALQCSTHKYTEKQQGAITFFVMLFGFYGFSILMVLLGVFGFFEWIASLFTPPMILLFVILLVVAIEVLCTRYELRILKKKLNLR